MNWNSHLIYYIWEISWKMWRRRCDFLHSTEEARCKILAANLDNKIDELMNDMPPNTHMTEAQRQVLSHHPPHRIKKWKAKRKIRWYRRAQIMKEAYEDHISSLRNSASSRSFQSYIDRGVNERMARGLRVQSFPRLQLNNPTTTQQNTRSLRQTSITNWMKGTGI